MYVHDFGGTGIAGQLESPGHQRSEHDFGVHLVF